MQPPFRIHHQRIDGEIPPRGVMSEILPEAHHRAPPIRLDILAQRRGLEGLARGDDGHRAVINAGRHHTKAGSLRRRIVSSGSE